MDTGNTTEKEIQPQEKRPLRYQETLEAFEDVIEKFYYECEIDVYRTAVNNPPTEFDITPARRRFEGEQGQGLPFAYTEEELDLMTESDKKKEVGHDAISVHDTEEWEIKEARRAEASFAKKHTPEEAIAHQETARGRYVMKLHITPETGLISKTFHNGHVLLREGVKIEDILAKDYEIKEFKYDNE